jgi:hypothetical protein
MPALPTLRKQYARLSTPNRRATTSKPAKRLARVGIIWVLLAGLVAPASLFVTGTPAPVSAQTTACPCSVWPDTATPAVTSGNDASAVELGFKFQSDNAGSITGVRFYKGSGNTGTHNGHLWSVSGQLLATAMFTNETASGWQTVSFATPVGIQANTTYVASYHTDVGHYAGTPQGLASSADNGPLHALASGAAGGNGVYVYGSGGFPNQSFNANNYWVDVVYSGSSATAPTPVPTAGSAAAGSFNCTEVIGFSQTNNWYTEGGNFEPTVGDARWQESWYSGGSIDLWANPDGAPWYAAMLSACASGSTAPDRVVVNASGAYSTDPQWWATQMNSVVQGLITNRAYPHQWTSVRQIVLQSVVGGPNGQQCSTTDTQPAVQFGINRASYNFPYINQGIDLVVANYPGLVVHGIAPTVDNCADYADGVGHLAPAAKTYLSTRIGQYYASGVVPTPTSIPAATQTPSATSTPVAGATSTPVAPTPTSVPGGCPCGLFSYSGLPAVDARNDTSPLELGLKFQSDSSGIISGVRFYKGAGNTGVHVGNLWSSGGQLLATGTFANESASGWQVVTFGSAVQIQANTTYVASYHTNTGHYSATDQGLASQVDYASLHGLGGNVSGGNGVYQYGGGGFPSQSYQNTNYWADVVFSPGASASVPPVTPTPVTSSGCPCTIFTSGSTPATAAQNDSSSVEVGVKIQSDTAGKITSLRFYKGAGNTGTHIGHLWSSTGQLLASATFANESATGWQQVDFAAPVTIQANTTYVASYHANSGHYAVTAPGLTSRAGTGPVHALASSTAGGNGVYAYSAAATFPQQSYNSSNYWVDVVYTP